MRQWLKLSSALALLLGAVAGGAGADTVPVTAEPSMQNLEHVFSFPFATTSDTQGTDIEFYTTVVPLRDATGTPLRDESGAVITAARDFAVVGDYGNGAYIFDITDPEQPTLARFIACAQIQNDPQLKQFGDRWLLALTSDNNARPCGRVKQFGEANGGISVWDVTDPVTATVLFRWGSNSGAHNFTWHPTKPFGWISTGDIPGGRDHLPIVSFEDLSDVKLVADLPSVGSPHDVMFNADGSRAYVAGEHHYRIYDSTDPANPQLLSATPTNGTYAHTLEPSPDGTIMVGTAESLAIGGFFVPGTAVCPGEGITFYGIEGALEHAPVPLGHFVAPVAGPLGHEDARACTAHQGKIAPNSRVIVLGWYAAGVRVVDFSNPSAPVEVAHAVMPGTSVWAARFYKGPYIFTGDETRGFDVYRWSGPGDAPWTTPA